jgi:hypothetical protein
MSTWESNPALKISYIWFTYSYFIVTRNTSLDQGIDPKLKKICDAIAVAIIVTNCAGVETSKCQYIGLPEFRQFLHEYQEEVYNDHEICKLIQVSITLFPTKMVRLVKASINQVDYTAIDRSIVTGTCLPLLSC